MRVGALLAAVAASLALASAATKLTVVVVEPKTGKFIPDLKANEFSVLDDKTPRTVESVEPGSSPVDVLLLLDTSLAGPAVQPVAVDLISQLEAKEQMAVVSVHSSADLIQEFTSGKEILRSAIQRVRYGNFPRLLDGLYAAIDGGFDNAVYRRVAMLLTTGYEGSSRVEEKDVIRLARKSGISIVPVYISGAERSMFEKLARQTGGVSFNLNEMRTAGIPKPGGTIFETVRQFYTVTISGNLSLSDKLRVELKTGQKAFVSALPQE